MPRCTDLFKTPEWARPKDQHQPQNLYLHWLKKTARKGFSYEPYHFQRIADLVWRMLTTDLDRVRIHMPPRHGKTETVTKRLAVYLLLHHPGVKILVTGFSQRFANSLSRSIREDYLRSGRELSGDSTAKDQWITLDGSIVMARGVGTPPTGDGFDFIIIDDPIRDRKLADSQVFRDSLEDWYVDGILTRTAPNCKIIGIWTLWHEDDLAGRLDAKAQDGGDVWEVLKLPAINDQGDALWPEVWPIEALNRKKAAMTRNDGARSWEALYQQNPSPREGSFFKVSRLEIVDTAPADLQNVVRAWDKAATEGDGDFTAGVKMAVKDGIYYILDVVRGQWDSAERDRIIRQTAMMDTPSVSIRGPQDPGAAGKTDAQAFVRLLSGFAVRTEPVTGDKQLRADPFASQVNAGNVRIVACPWNRDFIEELRTFPLGKHDDQVDAAADAFKALCFGGWTSSLDQLSALLKNE